MVIWKDKQKERHVEFVSYDGKYPTLCIGTLTLKINNEITTFGNNKESMYDKFWSSSGGVISDDCTAYSGEWEIHEELLPEQFKKYAAEIDKVFNENVEFGCCGGCI